MQFTFDEDQLLAAQALREVLDDHCTGADLRRAAEIKDATELPEISQARRRSILELGLNGALVPEALGGLGLKPVDVLLLAEEAGRAALPEPLIDTVAVAVPLLVELAQRDGRAEEALRSIVAGETIRILWPSSDVVHDLEDATYVLGSETDETLELKHRADLRSESLVSVDPLRRLARPLWDSATPIASVSDSSIATLWSRARTRARVFDAAQLIGLASKMTALAVAYSLERKQFGKAIGANQAVKHQLANVQVKIEFSRPVVYAAAAALGATLSSPEAVARRWVEARAHHAFVAACDAADLAARTAIQVHGAMGYSWELDLQFYAKRSWVLAGLHGGRSNSFATIHDSLLRMGIDIGPDRTFG